MENSKNFLEDMGLLKYRFSFDDKDCGIIGLVASLEKRINELEERIGKIKQKTNRKLTGE